jgi:hypothetical protein
MADFENLNRAADFIDEAGLRIGQVKIYLNMDLQSGAWSYAQRHTLETLFNCVISTRNAVVLLLNDVGEYANNLERERARQRLVTHK